MNDLAFAEQLRDLMGLDPNVPLDFVSDPSKRQGYYPGWLYRAMLPSEKKAVVQAYCGGESASSIAKRLKRGRSTIVNLLKGVGIYLSLLEKDEKKIEEWRTRFSEFIAPRRSISGMPSGWWHGVSASGAGLSPRKRRRPYEAKYAPYC
jgi:hypothetical protein